MKNKILFIPPLLLACGIALAQQSTPETGTVFTVKPGAVKQLGKGNYLELPAQDAKKLEQGYAIMANQTKNTPAPSITVPLSKEELAKKIEQAKRN